MESDRNGRIRMALAAVVFASGIMGCFAAQGEDLVQVYAMSKDSDPKYKAAHHEFEAIKFAEPQALAGLLPTVSLEYADSRTEQRIISSANTVYGAGTSNYPVKNTTLSLTQPIFKLAAWAGYTQAKAKVRQATASFAATEQDLMLRVATAYLNVLGARDVLEFSEAERDAIKRQLDVVRERFQSKLVARVGLHEAQARYEIKEADVVAARNDLDDKLQALREMTGKPVTVITPLREDIPLELPEPADIHKWIASGQEQNLQLLARRQQVEIAREEISRQRSGHAPVVDLVATRNNKDTGGSLFGGGSNVETTDLMVRVTVPIYSGGATTALTGEAVSRYHASLEDLEREVRQVERQVRSAFQGVTGGVMRVKALAQGVTSALSARELKVEGYKSGIGTVLQVLDAERDLYAAKRDSAKARYDLLFNRLRLKQSVGTLSEEDLAEVNRLMN
jgi:outer membrane protein